VLARAPDEDAGKASRVVLAPSGRG
jgi:hypothetical protein